MENLSHNVGIKSADFNIEEKKTSTPEKTTPIKEGCIMGRDVHTVQIKNELFKEIPIALMKQNSEIDIKPKDVKKSINFSGSLGFKERLGNFLKKLSNSILCYSAPEEPNKPLPGVETYKKSEKKTRDVIPTEKHVLSEGSTATVHRGIKEETVVKKSEKTMMHEYTIGKMVEGNSVFCKLYRHVTKENLDGTKKFKVEMEQIKGVTIGDIIDKYGEVAKEKKIEKMEKLQDEVVVKTLNQLKGACLHAFEKKVAWSDTNEGNLFITKENDLKIIDYGQWKIMEQPFERGKQLLLGAIEMTWSIVEGSELVKDKTKQEKISIINEIIFPKELFNNDIKTQEYKIKASDTWDSNKNTDWAKEIVKKLSTMNEQQTANFLDQYIDLMINKFEKKVSE